MKKVSPSARRLRWRLQGRSILLLTAVWLMISGWYSPISILGGLLLSWAVTVLFPLPPLHFRGRLHPWGVVKLVGHTLWELARPGYATLAAGAIAILPDWARDLLDLPLDRLAEIIGRPLGRFGAGAVRWGLAGVGAVS